MPTFTEANYAAEHLLSEANGDRSRATGTILSGQNLRAGAVLGRVTASGSLRELAPAASDGSQTAAAILYAPVNATAGAQPCVINIRDCEVNGRVIAWPTGITTPQRDAAIAQLAALGIIVR